MQCHRRRGPDPSVIYMSQEASRHQIPADDFARRFSLRARNLMWFLGAGASASAGLPTAMDMIWEFKQALFIS